MLVFLGGELRGLHRNPEKLILYSSKAGRHSFQKNLGGAGKVAPVGERPGLSEILKPLSIFELTVKLLKMIL
jgi:hypothetical protein